MAKKELKTITISLLGTEAATVETTDTVKDPQAKYALDSFRAENYMDIVKTSEEYLVPFHAVDHIIVTKSETEVEDRPNPYGCEADGNVGGSRVGC